MCPPSHVTSAICWKVIFSDQVHGRMAGPLPAQVLHSPPPRLTSRFVEQLTLFLTREVIDGGGMWSTVVRGGEKKGPAAHFGGGQWR